MAKKNNQQPKLSPENYIRQKARTLPIYECYISDDIYEVGEASIVITRRHENGKVTIGFFLVDIYCLGVKNAGYSTWLDEFEYKRFITKYFPHGKRISYEEAHNWIYGAIAFAEEAGIKPHKDFNIAKFILEEDTEDIPLIEYEFGKNGKHFLIANSYFEAQRYLPTLKKNLSSDNFDFIINDDEEDDFDKYEEEEEEYNEEDDEDEYENPYLSKCPTEHTYKTPEYPKTINLNHNYVYEILKANNKQTKLNKKDIDTILTFPIDTLRQDLRQIILFSLNKLSNIQPIKTDQELAKIIKAQNYCGFHALTLLSFIGNSDDLDILLEVLCQDPLIILQFTPGGMIHEIIPPLIYKLGESKLNRLTDLIQTNGILYFSHIAIFEAILMLSYLQPNRKKECINWFDNAFQFYFNKIENGAKVANDLMDELMQRTVDFNDPKLNQHIKLLFDKYKLDSSYFNCYDDIKNNTYSFSECIDYWQSSTSDINEFYENLNP